MNTPATDNDDTILLLTRPQDGCACLTLNRPQAMNALSLALRRALVRTLDTLAQDDSVRVLILTGAGRAFCAGLDLREIDPGAITGDAGTDVATALANFPRPVIGAVNGAAITGGLEVALACDLLIASSEARFADTHARIGVIPGWGCRSGCRGSSALRVRRRWPSAATSSAPNRPSAGGWSTA